MDKQNPMVFENKEFDTVRTLVRDGEPWFAAADVCEILEIKNPGSAAVRLDEDEKMTVGLTDGHLGQRIGAQMMNVVNECGLYTLILRSRKQEAKDFRRWITREVIPSIRKHGAYMTESEIRYLEENPDVIPACLKMLRDGNSKAKELRKELTEAKIMLSAAKPKADYYDAFIIRADTTQLPPYRQGAERTGAQVPAKRTTLTSRQVGEKSQHW